jgi:hypothetical protein
MAVAFSHERRLEDLHRDLESLRLEIEASTPSDDKQDDDASQKLSTEKSD